MPKQLLTEYKAPDRFLLISKRLTESEGGGNNLIVMGIFGKIGAKNHNGRRYPAGEFERNLKEGGQFDRRLRRRSVLGELEHPESGMTHLERVSHLITKAWIAQLDEAKIREYGYDPADVQPGTYVLGEMEILNTPKGQILRALYEANVDVGVSSRGQGDTRVCTEGSDKVEEVFDYELDTWDAVYQPSVEEARPKLLRTESKEEAEGSAPTWKKEGPEILRSLESLVAATDTDIKDLVEALASATSLAKSLNTIGDVEAKKIQSALLSLMTVLADRIMKIEVGSGEPPPEKKDETLPAELPVEEAKKRLKEGTGIGYDSIAAEVMKLVKEKCTDMKDWDAFARTELRKIVGDNKEAEGRIMDMLASEDYLDTGEVFLGEAKIKKLTEADLKALATTADEDRKKANKSGPVFKGEVEAALKKAGHEANDDNVKQLTAELKSKGLDVKDQYESITESIDMATVQDGMTFAISAKKLLPKEGSPACYDAATLAWLEKQEGDVLVNVKTHGAEGVVVNFIEPAYAAYQLFIAAKDVKAVEPVKEKVMKLGDFLTEQAKQLKEAKKLDSFKQFLLDIINERLAEETDPEMKKNMEDQVVGINSATTLDDVYNAAGWDHRTCEDMLQAWIEADITEARKKMKTAKKVVKGKRSMKEDGNLEDPAVWEKRGIKTITDFCDTAKMSVREFKGILRDWEQGIDVEADLTKVLKSGFAYDDIETYAELIQESTKKGKKADESSVPLTRHVAAKKLITALTERTVQAEKNLAVEQGRVRSAVKLLKAVQEKSTLIEGSGFEAFKKFMVGKYAEVSGESDDETAKEILACTTVSQVFAVTMTKSTHQLDFIDMFLKLLNESRRRMTEGKMLEKLRKFLVHELKELDAEKNAELITAVENAETFGDMGEAFEKDKEGSWLEMLEHYYDNEDKEEEEMAAEKKGKELPPHSEKEEKEEKPPKPPKEEEVVESRRRRFHRPVRESRRRPLKENMIDFDGVTTIAEAAEAFMTAWLGQADPLPWDDAQCREWVFDDESMTPELCERVRTATKKLHNCIDALTAKEGNITDEQKQKLENTIDWMFSGRANTAEGSVEEFEEGCDNICRDLNEIFSVTESRKPNRLTEDSLNLVERLRGGRAVVEDKPNTNNLMSRVSRRVTK